MAIEMRLGKEGKECSSCRGWRPLTAFFRDRTHGDSQAGRHCRCKDCYKHGRKKQALQRALVHEV